LVRESSIKWLAGESFVHVRALAFDPIFDERRRDSADASMRILKIVVSLTTMLAAALAIASLWTHPILLAFALTALAVLKHRIFPIKYELAWFLFVGMLGGFAESIIIMAGAWTYPNFQIANIPLWLPAIWGLTGTSLVVCYSGITGQH
jgi:hypothetical protein